MVVYARRMIVNEVFVNVTTLLKRVRHKPFHETIYRTISPAIALVQPGQGLYWLLHMLFVLFSATMKSCNNMKLQTSTGMKPITMLFLDYVPLFE